MKKLIILCLIVLLVIVVAFFAYKFFNPTPKLSDNAKNAWIEICATNSKCIQGVETHYLGCVKSLSFEKPKNKSDMAEYISLTKLEIESCLSDKIGINFPSS